MFPGRCEDRNKGECESRARNDFTKCAWNGTSCYTVPISDCGRLKCYPPMCIPGDGFDRRCVACQNTPNCAFNHLYPDTCRDTRDVTFNSHESDPQFQCRNAARQSRTECSEYKHCQHCKGECFWSEVKNQCVVNVKHANSETDCKAVYKMCVDQDTCEKCQDPTLSENCMWCELPTLNSGLASVWRGQPTTLDTPMDSALTGQPTIPDPVKVMNEMGCFMTHTGRGVTCSLSVSSHTVLYFCALCDGLSNSHTNPSLSLGASCGSRGNCTLCHDKPECGWCDDKSGTGTGTCTPGAYNAANSEQMCPVAQWYYALCPLCQCNGHSSCKDGITCDKCRDRTQENQCVVNVKHANSETDCKAVYKMCVDQDTCEKCQDPTLSENCMWCELPTLNSDGSRTGQCVERSTYYIRYPYGQCVDWTANHSGPCKGNERDGMFYDSHGEGGDMFLVCQLSHRLSNSHTNPSLSLGASCGSRGNCTLCHDKPECGWCDDKSGTGTGTCTPGAYNAANSEQMCPVAQWYYALCPLCQCNGHSSCKDGITCDKCRDRTQGATCGMCSAGYFGDATNAGQCRPCECGELTTGECEPRTGACTCNTNGVTGHGCDECAGGFMKSTVPWGGRVTESRETCLQVLQLETSSRNIMKGTLDRFNFILELDDNISDFNVYINCSRYPFELNTTMAFPGETDTTGEDKSWSVRGTEWKGTFQQSKYGWSVTRRAQFKIFLRFNPSNNTTAATEKGELKLYKRDIAQIDLSNFFGIFFGCIGILLGVFTIAWYTKVRYYQYRTLQQHELQRTERALRPYQSHKILFRDTLTPLAGRIFEVRPLGIEALNDDRFGIVSYLISLPGQSDINLAIGSGTFIADTSFRKIYTLQPAAAAAVSQETVLVDLYISTKTRSFYVSRPETGLNLATRWSQGLKICQNMLKLSFGVI
eukprot:sb/3461783/